MDDFKARIESLWKQIEPLYLQIHAYVRRKIWEQYGNSVLSRKGPIPAHLLGKHFFNVHCYLYVFECVLYVFIGDMWAQSWERLDEFTRPYPNTDDINPTTAMINQVNTKLFNKVKCFKDIKTFLFYFI